MRTASPTVEARPSGNGKGARIKSLSAFLIRWSEEKKKLRLITPTVYTHNDQQEQKQAGFFFKKRKGKLFLPYEPKSHKTTESLQQAQKKVPLAVIQILKKQTKQKKRKKNHRGSNLTASHSLNL